MNIPSKGKTYKVGLVYDLHCPYHSEYAVDIACKILEDYKPDIAINGGDAVDMYGVSRFDRDPDRFINSIQKEIDVFHEVQWRFMDAAPTQWYLLKGNHEDRLRKYLWRNPELHSLRSLQLPAVLGLDIFDMPMINELNIGKTTFRHGDIIRKHSAYTGKALLENVGYSHSEFCGHTHRGGLHYKTTGNGMVQGVECYCLCDISKADYTRDPNWQMGMVVVEVHNGRPFPELIPFHGEGSQMFARWRGKEYVGTN